MRLFVQIRVDSWLEKDPTFPRHLAPDFCSSIRVQGEKFRENWFECKQCLHHGACMHATIYGRGQMVIPAKARKEARIDTGDVVNVLPEGDGRLLLVRMERPKPKPRNKVRIVRRKGKHSLLSIGRPISREEIFKALEQFPP
jgi:AbrB family looped-hinge helix DNA binding protein